jgi:hypothetical protein
VVISDFIGSPGFAGDHLGFFSHRIGSPSAAGDYLGIPSPSRLSPSRLPLTSQDSVGLGCSSSTARPRSRHLGCSPFSTSSRWPSVPFGTPVLYLDLWVSHRQWVSVAPPAPPGLAGAFLPLVALGFLSGFDSWLSGYRVSAILLL